MVRLTLTDRHGDRNHLVRRNHSHTDFNRSGYRYLLRLGTESEFGLLAHLHFGPIHNYFQTRCLRNIELQGDDAWQFARNRYLIGGLRLRVQLYGTLIRSYALPQSLDIRSGFERRKAARGRLSFGRLHHTERCLTAELLIDV